MNDLIQQIINERGTEEVPNLVVKDFNVNDNKEFLEEFPFKEIITNIEGSEYSIFIEALDKDIFTKEFPDIEVEEVFKETDSEVDSTEQENNSEDDKKDPEPNESLKESIEDDINGKKIITSAEEASEDLQDLLVILPELGLGNQVTITDDLNQYQIQLVKKSDTKVEYTSPSYANSGIITFEEAINKAISECEVNM